MRAVVKNGIGVFSPQGFLDGNSSGAFLSIEDIEATLKLKNVNMILVSLKKVIFFNRNGLDTFVKMLTKVRTEKQITVGFCDYDYKKYEAIQKFYKDEFTFSLFATREIATLFATNYNKTPKNVLLYSEDKSQRSAMAIELHDNGHNPVVAQSEKDFNEKKANGKFDVIINNTYLGQMGQNVATRVTGNAIIYTLNSFLDAEIGHTFNIAYHNNSLNVGFRLFIFDAYKVISMNVHALNFFSKLSSAAAEYNATICFVGMNFNKTPISFKETMEDAGILFYDQMDDILGNKELLQELGAGTSVNTKNKRGLTKAIVSELPNFIEATVATLEMMTNAKAKKTAAEIHSLNIEHQEQKIASSIGYYGDLDGMIILVFPKNIAKKACELLIGEKTDDEELILDTLAELVNIVGGKIKTLLLDEGHHVNITLPRTYEGIDELLEVVNDKKGVQVDLTFENDEFLFFLTR